MICRRSWLKKSARYQIRSVSSNEFGYAPETSGAFFEPPPKQKINPEHTTVPMFPGQGSQFVGMGRKLIQFPKAQQLYDCASSILGYDVLKLCLEGPEEDLNSTLYCQPAVYVTSLAAVEKLREERPAIMQRIIATVGFSVGEYSALTLAGALTFEDGVRLVQERAEAMSIACKDCPSGMLVIKENYNSKLSTALQAARQYIIREGEEKPVCQVANYLFTQCKVIGGHRAGIQFLQDNAKEFGLTVVRKLKVSGAFHTPLMEEANERLKIALSRTTLYTPTIPVYSNVTGTRFPKDPRRISQLLRKQLTHPVKWEQAVAAIFERKGGETLFPTAYEVGPSRQLTTILYKINAKAANSCIPVDT